MTIGRGLPLVGRDAEMAALREVAASAAAGEPAGAVLTGEAGVGKTRLVEELAHELRQDGAVVVTSHGVELSGGELPYAGVAELVRGLVRVVGAAELTRAAGRDLRPLGGFDRALGDDLLPDRAAVTAALLAAVEGLGRRRTLVWVVDDLQWLDGATRDLVGYVARVVQEARLLLLATVRESAAPEGDGAAPELDLARVPGMTTIPVRPLSAQAVDAQARSLSDHRLSDADLDRIRRQSDGLPFFVEELVAAHGAVPSTLRKAVTMTTRDLTDDTRLLLRAAALEESVARPDLLGAVVGLQDAALAAALAEARSRDVLRLDRDTDLLRFRHALLRDAVDDEMLAVERRRLHERWAEVLDGAATAHPAAADLVVARARHRYAAGDREAAYPAVRAAAEYVDGIEDAGAQALWWERLLSVWPGDQDSGLTRDRVLWNLLEALVRAGEVERAAATLAPEVTGSTDEDRLRALWLLLVRRRLSMFVRDRTGVPAVPGDADELLAWLRGHPQDFRVSCSLHFLLHEWDSHRPDLYLPLCDELARRGEAEGDTETWYLAQRHRGWWLQGQGDFAGQLETARAAREVVLARIPSRRLEAEWDWCWGLEESGRYAEACVAVEEALASIEEPRAVIRPWTIVACCAGAASAALGRWPETERWLTRIGAENVPGPDGPLAALIARLAGTIAARRGDVAGSEHALDRVPLDDDDAREPNRNLPLVALESEVALITGDRARALHALAQIEGTPHAVGAPDDVVEALLSLSRGAEPAREAADQEAFDRVLAAAERLVPAGGPVQTVARAELTEHGRRVDGVDTAAGWASVVDAWRSLGRVYDVAWCRHLEAAAAVREGRRDVAAAAAREAWRIAGELGAEPLRERIAAVARRGRMPLDGTGSTAVGGLTERETEVLRLVALGRTNAQIAGELAMSPKTASVHVSRILAKLGTANRTEAAAAARRLGLD